MLSLNECRPGVEVICINTDNTSEGGNSSNLRPLRIGNVYTIERLVTEQLTYMNYHNDKVVPVIFIQELNGIYPSNGGRWAYGLHRFKTLKKKDIQIFYDILNQPIDQKISEDA